MPGKTGDRPPPYSAYAPVPRCNDEAPADQPAEGEFEVDGKVDFDVDSLSRRLSRVSGSSIQGVEEYVSGRAAEALTAGSVTAHETCPPLNIVIQVVGSRGDVQPFLALALSLQNFGHRVRLATHSLFQDLVQDLGIEFFSIGGDPAELMAYMVKNPGIVPGMKSMREGDVVKQMHGISEILTGCWRSCFKNCDCIEDPNEKSCQKRSCENKFPFNADAIIANPPSFAHIHCAEKLGIPLHIMFTMPWTSTRSFPHPLVTLRSSNVETGLSNHISYVFFEWVTWQGLGSVINDFRSRRLGLPRLDTASAVTMVRRARVPHTYCWSKSLLSKPKDWAPDTCVAGFFQLPRNLTYQPSDRLTAFLACGPTPIYIGFGSIVVDDPDKLTGIVFEALRIVGLRAVVSKGWGGLGAAVGEIPKNVYMLDDCPHDWLFPQVRCVVHHGGAGTTFAGLVAGKPTIIVPFFGDQLFWGTSVHKAGAGPKPIPWRMLTGKFLGDAITAALNPEVVATAKTIASDMREEEGSMEGLRAFHRNLPLNAMSCSILPDRKAVWAVRRTGLRLCGAAFECLRIAGHLKPADVNLLRVCDYETKIGALDPLSGGGKAIYDLFYETFKGFIEIGSEFTHRPYFGHASISKSHAKHSVETSLDTADTTNMKHREASRQVVGLQAAKGFGRIAQAAVRAPMKFTVAMAEGAHNMPRLWGDRSVRPPIKVTGLKSGFSAGCQEFFFGTYDGITGLVGLPIKGAQEDGVFGFAKGIGRGVAGMPVKFWAAMSGITGFPMQGIDEHIKKRFVHDDLQEITSLREAEGEIGYARLSTEEVKRVKEEWARLA